MTFKPLPPLPISLPGTGNKKTAMGEVLDEARAGRVAGVDPTTVPQGGAQPYTDLAARHAASLREVGGNAGRLLRGDTSNIGGTMKGVVVDFLLGSLVGVPMEAVDQAGYDAAATGLSMVESAASGGATATDARAWQFRNKGTPQEMLARGMGLAGTGAVGIATGGVGAGARLPAAVRALDILTNGAASPLLAGAGKLVGKGRAARKAQAVAVDADQVKAALAEAQAAEAAEAQAAADKAKSALGLLQNQGPSAANYAAFAKEAGLPGLGNRVPVDKGAMVPENFNIIRAAKQRGAETPKTPLVANPERSQLGELVATANKLGVKDAPLTPGPTPLGELLATARKLGENAPVPTQGRLVGRGQDPLAPGTLQPTPNGAAKNGIAGNLTPAQVSLGERLTLLETLGDQQAVGRPLIKRILGTTRLADDGKLPNPEADAALVRLIADHPTLTPEQLTGRVDGVRGLLGLAPEGTPTLGGYVARLEKLYGTRQGGRRNAEANLAKMLGVKISPRTGAWSYNGADVTPLRDPFLDERVGLSGKAAKDAQVRAFRERLEAGVDPGVSPPAREVAPPAQAADNPKVYANAQYPGGLFRAGTEANPADWSQGYANTIGSEALTALRLRERAQAAGQAVPRSTAGGIGFAGAPADAIPRFSRAKEGALTQDFGKDRAGWKLHVNVYDWEPANLIADWLDANGIGYKLGRAAEENKGITIYLGSRDNYEAVAEGLQRKFGGVIPPATGVPDGDERVVGNIWGRFDTHGALDFEPYGIDGHPQLRAALGDKIAGRTEATKRFGDYYTGTKAQEVAPPLAAANPEIASLEESLGYAKERVRKLKATGAASGNVTLQTPLREAQGQVKALGIRLSIARKKLDNPGLVAPSARLLLQNPEVGTTALGAAGGAWAGGEADPDGGLDGYIGGAIAGGAAGLGIGRAIDTPLSRVLQLGLKDAKREFADAWTNGTISRKTVFTDVKRAMTATPRGFAIDWLGNLVRSVAAGVPRKLYKESGRNLEKNWSATKPGDVRKLRSDRVDGLLAKVGVKADEYDWTTKYGQGYITEATKGEGQLHPLAGAASGVGQALWNPASYLTGGLSVGLDAALGFGRSATGAVFKTANEFDQYTTRDAAFINETEGLLNQVAVSFKATLKGMGIDASALPDDGQFLPADADTIAPGLGQLWTGLVRQVVGTPALKVGGQDIPAVDGLASEAVKAAFGDYATRQGWEKAIESVAMFARYNLGQYKVLAKLATDNPAATMLLARWLQRDRTEAQATGRPGYQIGTVRVDTETPLVGRLVRAQLGGGNGEGRISPTATALGLQGSQVGAADKLSDAAEGGDLYALTEAVLGLAGFQPNPIIANLAYVVGGTERAPGPLSRTAGLGAVFGGPKVPTVRGLLDNAREALGNEASNYDPIDALAKEIIMEASGKPASDPANRAYMAQLLDPNSPLLREAQRRYAGGRAASNAVSLLSPITAQVNTDEKVAYRQAKVDQAAREVKTGAAATYKNPKYPQGAVVGGKKKDPRLFQWEQDMRTIQALAPSAYAQMRFKFIRENGIKE